MTSNVVRFAHGLAAHLDMSFHVDDRERLVVIGGVDHERSTAVAVPTQRIAARGRAVSSQITFVVTYMSGLAVGYGHFARSLDAAVPRARVAGRCCTAPRATSWRIDDPVDAHVLPEQHGR